MRMGRRGVEVMDSLWVIVSQARANHRDHREMETTQRAVGWGV
jgi:hypothetical protein